MGILKNLNKAVAISLLYFLPSLVSAEILQVTLTGSVTEVDSEISSEFSVGDTFEYGITLDTSTAFDVWGASTGMDGTRLHSPSAGKNNYFKIGSDYTGTHPGSVQPIFVDNWSSIGPTQQGFSGGINNFDAPDVNGYSWAEVYLKFGFTDAVFTGVDDPEDIIDVQQLKQLDGIAIYNIQSLIAYHDGSGGYYYVNFEIAGFSVQDITPTEQKVVYIDQVGLSDTDGNGMPEIATLYISANNRAVVIIRDALSDAAVKKIRFFSQGFIPKSVTVVPDMNGNGTEELAVFGEYPNDTKVRTLIKDAQTGDKINFIYQKK